LTAQAAGGAAPLAFAIRTAEMAIVGLSFLAFSGRTAHAGSAYAYVSHTFGRRWGFIAGWALPLTYLTYTGALETGLPVAPFAPSAEFDGWSGVGYGLVFTVLSFRRI
jgi:amino acid transporter